jgi:hypothetical protein
MGRGAPRRRRGAARVRAGAGAAGPLPPALLGRRTSWATPACTCTSRPGPCCSARAAAAAPTPPPARPRAAAPQVLNPATGKPLVSLPKMKGGETAAAIAAAHSVLPAWSGMTAKQRGAVLRK